MTSVRGLTHHPAPPPDPRDLDGFPERTADGDWYRAHVDRVGSVGTEPDPDHGCWWFSSVGPDPEASGRFDLPAPHGTCYFASSEEAAARERVGTQLRRIAGRESVTEGALVTPDGPVVVTCADPGCTRAANLPVKAAQRWLNRSLGVGTGIYPTAQAWAQAFHVAGFDGVVYEPRFSGGPRVRALARFGPAGRPLHTLAVGGSTPLREVLTRCGVRVVAPPARSPAVLAPDAPPPPL